MPANEPILHTNALAAGYGGQAVLREIEFSLHPGEICALIGPNGVGKSTLLKTLSRILLPIAGTVFLNRRPIESLNENEIARSMSIVMTDRVETEHMTCADIVSAGRYPYTGRLGILSAYDWEQVDRAMDLAHVRDLRTQNFQHISDGQRQRVMLARSICQEPDVLIMDEPAAFLDIRYQLELLTLLRSLADQQNLAVLISLHELTLVRDFCDTVLCLRDGKADRIGPPKRILSGAYIEMLYDMPSGSGAAYFHYGDSAFFQNRSCEMFPCHDGVVVTDFNCLFCYCPLYTLGKRCGGNFQYTERGIKSCMDCAFPHERSHYNAVLARFPELSQLAAQDPTGHAD